ncbi:hypothetical protein [Ralstonia pseudosolanacearum]
MSMNIDTFAKTVLSASRKGLFRRRSVFKAYARVLPDELRSLERKIGIPVPIYLCDWLLAVGYGDIDEGLSFRKEWFAPIEKGQLKGGARFAQDILGNFYAFDSSGRIYFLSRSEPVFAAMSKDFLEFVGELIRRDYKLGEWIDTLETQGYEW